MSHLITPKASERYAGVVLCGGLSRRMGYAKAWLPFGQEVLLQRVVRVLGETLGPVVVVAAADQPLPELPAAVQVVLDRKASRGPLEGLAAGLAALVGSTPAVDSAFVTACDMPRLSSAFIERVLRCLEDGKDGAVDIAVPHWGGCPQPLSAAYRLRLLPQIEAQLAADRLRLLDLLDVASTRTIPEDELQRIAPAGICNLNTPADYFAELAACGLPLDPQIAEKLHSPNGP